MSRLDGTIWKTYQFTSYHCWNGKLNGNMQGRKGSAIGVINVEITGILGALGISLDKIDYGSIRIKKNRGLENVSLIQHKSIN